MDGFVAASGTQWARVYFVAYYFIAVIVCLNLFTSFVLEAVTKVDVEEWSGTPHGSLFETPFSVSVNQELLAEGGGRWRMSTDMRRSFVQDPFEQPAASPALHGARRRREAPPQLKAAAARSLYGRVERAAERHAVCTLYSP